MATGGLGVVRHIGNGINGHFERHRHLFNREVLTLRAIRNLHHGLAGLVGLNCQRLGVATNGLEGTAQ